jgi:hypothetical protein
MHPSLIPSNRAQLVALGRFAGVPCGRLGIPAGWIAGDMPAGPPRTRMEEHQANVIAFLRENPDSGLVAIGDWCNITPSNAYNVMAGLRNSHQVDMRYIGRQAVYRLARR